MLIGAGASLLLLLNGKIAGISGILNEVVIRSFGVKNWRIAFLVGLVAPAFLLGLGTINFSVGLPTMAVSGLLVGVGTRLGNGCTSGHGVCGLANFSLRSLLATLTFISAAVVTVSFVRHGAVLWRS